MWKCLRILYITKLIGLLFDNMYTDTQFVQCSDGNVQPGM